MPAQIVIVGGGFGGLETAFSLRELLGSSADVTLIDRIEFHTFIPSIHEIISGKLTANVIQIPFSAILPAAGIRFVHDSVRAIDQVLRRVAAGSRDISFDFLVLATGAENTFYGVPGADAYALRFRTAEDAALIRQRLDSLLQAGLGGTRIVLAGGGTEGVEVAGEMVDYLASHAADDDLREGRVTIELIESKDRLLPGFPDDAGTAAEEILRSLGVSVRTKNRIVEADRDMLLFSSGDRQPFSLLVWSGGIRPSQLLSGLALRKNSDGWMIVDRQLRTPDDPAIFGVGDAISIHDEGEPLAIRRLAYHAQDQAVIAALNIAAAIKGTAPQLYVPRPRPQLISIGRNHGLMVQSDRILKSGWVSILKKAVEKKHILSCLTRPATSRIAAFMPGLSLYRRARMRLPL